MEEIDLKELIDMFLARKFLILFVIIVFAAVGIIYTVKLVVPKYESTTSLILVQTGTEISSDTTNAITTADLTLNSKLVDNYKAVCTSRSVLTKVITNLNLNYTYEELYSKTSVATKTDAEVITVTVRDEDPQKACQVANEIAKVFIDKVEELYNVKNIHVLDEALVASKPYNINLTKNVVIFAFVGAILVFAYILLVNLLDTTIKTESDIEKITGLPVLASIVYKDDDATLAPLKKHSSSNHENISTENNDNNKTNDNTSGTISMFSYLNDEEEDNDLNDSDSEKKGWKV